PGDRAVEVPRRGLERREPRFRVYERGTVAPEICDDEREHAQQGVGGGAPAKHRPGLWHASPVSAWTPAMRRTHEPFPGGRRDPEDTNRCRVAPWRRTATARRCSNGFTGRSSSWRSSRAKFAARSATAWTSTSS